MADQPLGNLDNPAMQARFKQYSRPVQPLVRRAQPQIFTDISDQFTSVNQKNLNSSQPTQARPNIPQHSNPKTITQQASISQQSQQIYNTNQQVSGRAAPVSNGGFFSVNKSQPSQVTSRPVQQVQQAPVYQKSLQPQPVSQPPRQIRQEQHPQNNQVNIENEILAELDQVNTQNTFIPQGQPVEFSQAPASQPVNLPVYLNNYNGEYEDKKDRRFSLKSVKFNKGPLILGSSVFATVLIAASFFTFMNWNNNKNVAQAQSARSYNNQSSQQSSGVLASSVEPTTAQIASYQVGPNLPRYLIIPKLNINSMITPVNLNSKNLLEAPNNIYNTGWWQSSSEPNQPGAMILDGFTSNGEVPGVFTALTRLAPGDKFEVERGDNSIFNYTVVKTTEFGTNGLNMDQAISPAVQGKNGLNIITCSGQATTCPSVLNSDYVVFAEQD